MPSGSEYGKLIKKCFSAPDDWLFIGSDFNALEARIDALLTKDPAKLAVYTVGYDSHAWNCYHYWKDQFPEVSLAEDTDEVYVVYIDGEPNYFKGSDLVYYKGNTLSVHEVFIHENTPKLP